jgi:CarD family transcriptional regulator
MSLTTRRAKPVAKAKSKPKAKAKPKPKAKPKARSGKPKPKARSKAQSRLKYKKGQEVVYPLQGVGKVVSIEERPFRAIRLLYYIIYLEVSDMTVMVPVDKADELGIRPIVDKRESQKALKLISEDFEPIPADWKLRYQMNLDLLKKGSVLDIATVVRALYHRSKIKELPILERKLYDNALRLLVDEISFSLDKAKDEVEALVMSKLELN